MQRDGCLVGDGGSGLSGQSTGGDAVAVELAGGARKVSSAAPASVEILERGLQSRSSSRPWTGVAETGVAEVADMVCLLMTVDYILCAAGLLAGQIPLD